MTSKLSSLDMLTASRLAKTLLAALVMVLAGCSSTGTAMKASPTLANALGIADIPLADLERDYTDAESEFVDINGYRIHYRDQGQGEPIILLHGIFSSLHTWDQWVPALSRHYRVITLDLPGFGLTGAPADPEQFNEDHVFNTFARFVDHLKLEQVSLVGNSFGGHVAAEYAAQYGNRVKHLVLLAPFGYPQELSLQMRIASSAPVAFLSRYVQSPIYLSSAMRDAYGDPRKLTAENAHRYVHMSQRPGAKGIYATTLQMIRDRAQSDDPRRYYRIGSPTLLMWGEEDRRVPLEQAERWRHDVRNAALVTYPGVGHMPMEEAPEETLKDALTFLNQGIASFKRAPAREPTVVSQ